MRIDALKHPLAELDLSTVRPAPKAFIYFLCRDGEIVYVGQTVEVAARIRLHLQDTRPAPKPFDQVFFFEVDPGDLDAFEGALIRALNPQHNLSAPRTRWDDAELLARLGIEPSEENARRFADRVARAWHSSRWRP